MQGAQLVVLAQRGQQRQGLRGVKKHGFSADLHPRRECAQGGVFFGLRQRQRAVAVDLDHIRLQVLGNQIARPALGDLAAVVEHQQPRTQALGLVHEVRGQQDRLALLQQHLQPLPHQVPRLWVKPGGGLVEQQQLGVVHQRARQRQAPAHAARQLAGLGVGLVRERGELQQLRHARTHMRLAEAEVAAVHHEVLGAAEVGVEGVELRHHAQLRLDGQRVARHLQAQRLDAAAIGRGEAQAHADGGGLARAVRPDHAQALAGRDLEREVVDDRGLAVALAQPTDLEQRGRGRRGRRGGGGVGWHAAILTQPADWRSSYMRKPLNSVFIQSMKARVRAGRSRAFG
ncbi:hypothetical protein D9M69_432230 [compost metagenome]